jgi:hypothetical protein
VSSHPRRNTTTMKSIKTLNVFIEVIVGHEAGGNVDEHSKHVSLRPAATLFRMLSGVNNGQRLEN